MSGLKLYNTLTRKKEIFESLHGGVVNLYTCGPTVYDHAHIGNLRSYISADILRRVLKYNGYTVIWVMNITDVDDKTIKRTVDEFGPNATVDNLREYTEKYFSSFKEDLKKINIPTNEPDIKFIRVSEKIDAIKDFIKKLIKLGYAYKTEDGVYFSIEKYQEKFGDYGGLVGENFLKGKKTGTRVKVDEYEKENLSDFALWKGRDPSDGNIFWPDAELGDGRPGWHIECSVINHEAFGGEPTDIHTGGVDLIFPHHTNEIAQSQAFLGKNNFVRRWIHSEHLLVDGKKMAKREKNFYTLADLEKIIPDPGIPFRYLVLQTHYQKPLNFTIESLGGAFEGLRSLMMANEGSPSPSPKEVLDEFTFSLNDNLNTPKALGISFKLKKASIAFGLLGILGLLPYDLFDFPLKPRELKLIDLPLKIRTLFDAREEARRNKQFIQSDRLRKEINDLGFDVEDTSAGPRIWPRNS